MLLRGHPSLPVSTFSGLRNNNHGINKKLQEIDTLRNDLKQSQQVISQYNRVLDDNIAWIRTHCDPGITAAKKKDATTASASAASLNATSSFHHLSSQAIKKCRSLALERIFIVMNGYLKRYLHYLFLKWKNNIFREIHQKIFKNYCRIKGLLLFGKIFFSSYRKLVSSRCNKWIKFTKCQKTLERIAAIIEIQRIMRSYLAKRFVRRFKINKAVVKVSSLLLLL
jgi:hypothetical protein